MLKKARKKIRIVPASITLALLLGAAALTFFVILPHADDIGRVFSSQEAFRAFVEGFGFWAPVVYVLLQAAQVIVAPIPGNVTTLAGGVMFGPVAGFLLSAAGMIAGSLAAFYLARLLGQRFVIKLVGQKQFDKYGGAFTRKAKLTLFLMFLVPFFPDDALCLLAGLSALPVGVFLVLLIARLPATAITALIGGGALAFSLWQWIVIGAVSLLVIALSFMYGDRIEDWLRQKFLRQQSSPGAAKEESDAEDTAAQEQDGPEEREPEQRSL
jgi:uncharacterized membrane protein YdjX (TVP38/TMEM64 family)